MIEVPRNHDPLMNTYVRRYIGSIVSQVAAQQNIENMTCYPKVENWNEPEPIYLLSLIITIETLKWAWANIYVYKTSLAIKIRNTEISPCYQNRNTKMSLS